MRYTKEQKQELERVISIFHNYILSNPYIDLVWSDKLGYVYFSNIILEKYIIGTEPVIIRDAETLCRQIFYELIYHALNRLGSIHDIPDITSEEKTGILQTLSPYIQQLPQYSGILNELLDATQSELS